jgi:hypothetical protein
MTRAAGYTLNDGDVVVTDSDPGLPFIVVAVHETKAWIRDLAGERELIIDHHRCAPVRYLQ